MSPTARTLNDLRRLERDLKVKQTITRLAAAVIDLAGEIGTAAEAVPDDAGIAGAECIIHLRDAQQALNKARDALHLAIGNKTAIGEDERPPS